jgi:endonuclease YncB( thermonuclease family)
MLKEPVFSGIRFVIIFMIILSGSLHATGEPPSIYQEEPGLSECDVQRVRRVIDGDTFDTRDGSRVRLIGPRRPVQWFAREASGKLKEWIDGKTVCLKTDRNKTMNTDRYGRLLRYVWRYPADRPSPDETSFFVNAELIQQGYAFAYTRYPFQYLEDFRKFERDARENNRGLWDKEKQEHWEREYEANRKLAETCGKDTTLCPEDARRHIGRFRTVRFFVEKSHDSGKAVFLNSTIDYTDPDNFTTVIFEKNKKHFPPDPADLYRGKTVDVSGQIKEYKGRAEIILKSSLNIMIIK